MLIFHIVLNWKLKVFFTVVGVSYFDEDEEESQPLYQPGPDSPNFAGGNYTIIYMKTNHL